MGGARQVRGGRRPISGRRLRLTSSFDDGCSGRERVSISVTAGPLNVVRTSLSSEKPQPDKSSATNQSQRARLVRSSSVSRIGANNGSMSSSPGCLRDQARSSATKDELRRRQTESTTNSSNRSTAGTHQTGSAAPRNYAEKTPSSSGNQAASSTRQLPTRPAVPARRTSLDTKTADGEKPTACRQPIPPQRSCKAAAGARSGTMSASGSPRPHRCVPVQSRGSPTSRYRPH